jgi:glycosidase/fibronectin type 3 domain-containing protein
MKRWSSVLNASLLVFFIGLLSLYITPQTVEASDNNVNYAGLGHNSRDPLYRSPQAAVTTGTSVRLRLRALSGDLTSADVRVWNDRINTSTLYPMTKIASDVLLPSDANLYELWEVTLPPSALPTVYWYRFIARDGSAVAYYEDDGADGGWGTAYASSPDRSWQLSIYDPTFSTPDWVKNGVMYQIFPDRFRDGNPANNPSAGEFFYGNFDTIYRSNGTAWNTHICDPRNVSGSSLTCSGKWSQNFYGGDLQGIIDELPYLNSLGVTVLYLNPIFFSPSNHKYDTIDFMRIDPRFGTLADFHALVAGANSYGMKIVLDGVFNHASSDSIYFDRYSRWDGMGNPTTIGANDGSGACESVSAPFTPWFTFFTYTGTPPAPCSSNRDYPKWFGIFDSLPVFQHDYSEVRDYFLNNPNSVARYWLNQGASGWRMDVAPEIDHGTINDPSDDYWEVFRTVVRATDPQAYIVGEEWGNAISWTLGTEWDATMNYQFSAAVLSFWRDTTFTDNDFNSGSSAGVLAPINATQLHNRLSNLEERYPREAFLAMMNLFNSHDTNRVLFLLDHNTGGNNTALYNNPSYDWSDALTRLRGAVLMQMTLPGSPTVYYGDEVGTVNPPAYDGTYWQDDPYNRVPYPWLDETGTPYYAHMQNVAARASLFNYYQTLINARKSVPALRTGEYRSLWEGGNVFVYGRKMADDTSAAVVAVNKGASVSSVTFSVDGFLPAGAILNDVLAGGTVVVSGSGDITLNVPARGGILLTLAGFGGRPPAVTTLGATSGAGSVNLSWTGVANADRYEVYRSQVSGGGYHYLGDAFGTTYNDTSVVNGKTYYYVIIAKNDATRLESGFSNEVSAMPQYTLNWHALQWPPTITHVISASTPTTEVYGQFYIAGATDVQNTPVAGIIGQVGYGPFADTPDSASWTWFPMIPNPGHNFAANDDEHYGTMLPTAVGTFNYTVRWSTDGGTTWVYSQKNPPGVGYNASNVGILTVNPSGDTTPPSAPTNLLVTGTTSASVTLGWDAHPNTDGDLYALEVWRRQTLPTTTAWAKIATLTTITATSYVDNAVTTSATYEYYLVAVDTSLNASPQSNTVSALVENRLVDVTFTVTVPAHTPAGETVYIVGNFGGFTGSTYPNWNPGGLAMTNVSANTWEITLTILDGYNLQYKYTRGEWERVEKAADGNTEISDRPLTVDYGMSGTQSVSDTVANWRDPYVVAFTPANGAIDVPQNSTITITWNQAMPATLSGFTFDGGSGTWAYNAGTFTHTFTPSALMPSGLRTVTVSGNVDVHSPADAQRLPTTWTFTVETPPDTTPPSAPTNLNVVNVSSTTVTLGWDVHPNVDGDLDGFKLYRKLTTDASYTLVATITDETQTSYTDTGLTPSTQYQYVLTAFDTSANESGNSNMVDPTTLAPGMIAVTFIATVPAGTPATLYIAGDFDTFAGSTYPHWNPSGLAMTQTSPTTWEITLNLPETNVFNYKYTRGSWDTVEKQADGQTDIANRVVTVTDGGSGTQTVNDTIANWRDPFVTAFTPANGASGLPASTVITWTWNQDMPAVITGYTVVDSASTPVTGTLSYNAGTRTHTFTPDNPLPDDLYTVTVSGNTDAHGDTQQVDSTWSFRVGFAMIDVTFIATVPAGTPATLYIAGDFDTFAGSTYPHWNPSGLAMTQTSPTTWEITLTLPETSVFNYKYTRGSWDTVEKQADGQTDIANRVVTVTDGGGGTQTVNDTIANWRDPFVTAFTPADSATVAPTTLITWTWNQDMPAVITGYTVVDSASTPVAGTLSYNAGTRTHTFTPDNPLPDEVYTVTVSGNTDAHGDTQQVDSTWSFTVSSAPIPTPTPTQETPPASGESAPNPANSPDAWDIQVTIDTLILTPGARVKFTITVRKLIGGTPVQVDFPLPKGFSLLGASSNRGAVAVNGEMVVYTDDIHVGDVGIVTVDALVGKDAHNSGTACITVPVNKCSTWVMAQVTQLPATGETPLWRNWLIGALVALAGAGALMIGVWRVRRARR